MNATNGQVTGELLQAKDATEAASVAAIVERCVEPKLVTLTSPDGEEVPVFQAPGPIVLRSVKALIDEYRTAPERRKGTAVLTELESFIALVKRFSDEDSALFADRSEVAPSLTAVLDYHEATADGSPRFGEHRARYDFPLSDEWKAWTASNGKQMSQADFAGFLEDRIVDVTDATSALEAARTVMEALLCTFASPSKLLDLARGLTVRVNSVVASQQNLANGISQLRYETSHADERGAPLEIPGARTRRSRSLARPASRDIGDAPRADMRRSLGRRESSPGRSFIARPRPSITRSPTRANRPPRKRSCRSTWASPSPDRREVGGVQS